MTQFKGLPNGLFRFLNDLKKNNNRQWFQDNKERYQRHVVEPMVEFMLAIQPKIAKLSPHIVVKPKAHNGSMFRIYRDTRFSKDKTPYKEHVSCHFRHEMASRDAHTPGFYARFAPAGVRFGGGIWLPESKALHKIRMAILDNPHAWGKVKTNKKLIKWCHAIEGDVLKRAPRGFPTEHIHLEDLKRKSFFAMHVSSRKVATSPELIKHVDQVYQAVNPLLDFIAFALDIDY